MTKDDVERAVNGTLLWDSHLYKSLVLALEARRGFEKETDPNIRRGQAALLARCALYVAVDLIGSDAMSAIYGADPADDAPQSQHLQIAWQRLFMFRNFYECAEQHDRQSLSSVGSLLDELQKLAHGDRSILLAEPRRPQKRPANSWKLAQRKMAALEWVAHLRAIGTPAGVAKVRVGAAFCNTDPDNFRKWRGSIIKAIGQERFGDAISSAERGYGYYSRIGLLHEIDDGLKKDAADYDAERRRSELQSAELN